MSAVTTYSNKAEKYARFRWSYAPESVEKLFRITGMNSTSTVVDLGAGTGILTRQLVGKVRKVMAVEPDPAMNRRIDVESAYRNHLQVITAQAETVPLAAHCADVIVVAQAIHWFDPEMARIEIQRLLMPDGWLALLRNYSIDQDLNAEFQRLNQPANGVVFSSQAVGLKTPVSFYFGHSNYQTYTFGFENRQDWTAYLGSLLSASFSPDEDHPLYQNYETAARHIFEKYAIDGTLVSHAISELIIGKIGASQ